MLISAVPERAPSSCASSALSPGTAKRLDAFAGACTRRPVFRGVQPVRIDRSSEASTATDFDHLPPDTVATADRCSASTALSGG
jgi:hypothetical protein